MMEASELLHAYLEGVRKTTGASSATLFVPPSLSGITPPLLVVRGEGPRIPELASLEAAGEWAESRTATSSGSVQASDRVRGCLIRLGGDLGAKTAARSPKVHAFRRTGPRPARRHTDAAESSPIVAWLGLVFPPERRSVLDALLAGRSPGLESSWWQWLLELGRTLAPHTSRASAVLQDPITGLPTRLGLHALLSDELERSRLQHLNLALLLVNPDDFPAINERFGREAGDRVVREIADRLRQILRGSDQICRYGGVVFAVTLLETPLAAAHKVARVLVRQLSETAYLGGAVRLGFSTGISVSTPDVEPSPTPLGLIRRADQALNAAKRLGGSCVVDWERRSEIEQVGNFDRLHGIFTGNMAKDYRNMVMLWETIHVVAGHPDVDELAEQVVERLYSTFKPDRVGLFASGGEGELELVRGLTRSRDPSGRQKRVATLSLAGEDRELIGRALAAEEPLEVPLEPASDEAEARGDGGRPRVYVVPLATRTARPGCIYLEGREDALDLDASDLVFLRALASQLSMALDRARLAELDLERREHEQRRMKAELNELRQALGQAKLVYRSAEMEAAVATARRVAPTDATVLVTGPSGTGKELLARTIHELSPRSDRAMVVVDCSAIPSSLIESELFGHEKGAYTGAEQRRSGRLAEADHGTLLLDEIAELPLEVQSRLLRFVQEKQFTPVGGTRARRVDVRILAATNRNLAEEVAAGRFREDLYYRLDVVSLAVPALKDRPEDILFLGRYFLEGFCLRYQKNVRRFTSGAESALLRHDWPGNVRELQNRVMQAVILSVREVIGPEELGLARAELVETSARPSIAEPVGTDSGATPASRPSRGSRPAPRGRDLLTELRASLGREIETSLRSDDLPPPPLGRWLGDDLVMAAGDAARGVARRGARIVGIPETTFRRRLQRARSRAEAGTVRRSPGWEEPKRWIAALLRDGELGGRNLLDVAEACLIEEILDRLPRDMKTGAALLGVSAPTYRRRVARASARRDGVASEPAGGGAERSEP